MPKQAGKKSMTTYVEFIKYFLENSLFYVVCRLHSFIIRWPSPGISNLTFSHNITGTNDYFITHSESKQSGCLIHIAIQF